MTDKTPKPASIGDRPTTDDTLNYSRYVDALVNLIIYEETKTPFTIAIDGAWGTGKSSLMDMMAERLDDLGVPTIRYNAWLYGAEGTTWAAIATTVIQQAFQHKKTVRGKIGLAVRLIRARYLSSLNDDVRRGAGTIQRLNVSWLEVRKSAARFLLYLGGAIALFSLGAFILTHLDIMDDAVAAVSVFGTVLIAAIDRLVRQSTNLRLGQYVRSANYQQRLGFLHEFRQDFTQVVAAITTDPRDTYHRLVIFIDDLDRCLTSQIADVVEAISGVLDTPNCVFVIGMETRVVAASLEVRYQDISQHLGGDSGLTMGYNFLEKIVQVSFRLPQPNLVAQKTFLQALRPSDAQQDRHVPARTHAFTERPLKLTTPMINAIEAVLPYLEDNPRRAKRFVSLYWLNILIYEDPRSDIHFTEAEPTENQITYLELADWVLLGMMYPDFVGRMQRDNSFDNRFCAMVDEYRQLDSRRKRIMANESITDPMIRRYINNNYLYDIVYKYKDMENEASPKRYKLYINQALSATTTAGTGDEVEEITPPSPPSQQPINVYVYPEPEH